MGQIHQKSLYTIKALLIIFVKHPIPGQVKTRLAASIGHEKALKAYQLLLGHTRDISKAVDASKVVFYGNQVPDKDLWTEAGYDRQLQSGDDLGLRMHRAFVWGFEEGFESVVLIGSDLAENRADILQDAFTKLQTFDTVIGPAEDGGYYLIGMKKENESFFQGIEWSTSTVCAETVAKIEAAQCSYAEVATISDVDTVEDLKGTFLEFLIGEE